MGLMSYGAARAFGTAQVMHICSRYAAVSVANTSLYWEPYSSDTPKGDSRRADAGGLWRDIGSKGKVFYSVREQSR